jgi:hypothetical protein
LAGKLTWPTAGSCGIWVKVAGVVETARPSRAMVEDFAFLAVTCEATVMLSMPASFVLTADGSVMASLVTTTSSGWLTGHGDWTCEVIDTVTGAMPEPYAAKLQEYCALLDCEESAANRGRTAPGLVTWGRKSWGCVVADAIPVSPRQAASAPTRQRARLAIRDGDTANLFLRIP